MFLLLVFVACFHVVSLLDRSVWVFAGVSSEIEHREGFQCITTSINTVAVVNPAASSGVAFSCSHLAFLLCVVIQ